jgi:5-methyltetrahydrofolate--homocysteine methyltransferase
MKLREYGLEQKQPEIVARAVEAARRGAGERDCLIAGSIGPLGNYLEPFGRVTTSAARACFAALARLLAGHGVDCIALETFTDLRELRIAASAVREALPRIPLIMSMSFDKALRTVTGSPVEVLADVSGAFAPGFAGINCGASLDDNEAAAIELLRHSSLPVSYQPNAGIPVSDGGEAHWPATPADLADSALRVCLAGAALVGSCCGSTPDHTRAIADAVKGMPAPAARPVAACSISSRTGRVVTPPRWSIAKNSQRLSNSVNASARPDQTNHHAPNTLQKTVSQNTF